MLLVFFAKSTYALLDVKSRALQEGAQQLVGIPGA